MATQYAYYSGWLRSPAKLNLDLHITGVLENGYHTLHSHIVPLALSDNLCCSFLPQDETGVSVRVPMQPELDGERNLITKVSRAFLSANDITGRVQVLLFKNIPAKAGLGGGSSNAATVLHWLNATIVPTPWPAQRLYEWSASYGADIPLFLYGKAALMEGIGEKLTPAAYVGDEWVVLLRPPADYSTQAVYAASDSMTEAQRDTSLPAARKNQLYQPAVSLCPGLAEARAALEDVAAPLGREVYMSGSGATFFVTCPTRSMARTILSGIRTQPQGSQWWSTVSRCLVDPPPHREV